MTEAYLKNYRPICGLRLSFTYIIIDQFYGLYLLYSLSYDYDSLSTVHSTNSSTSNTMFSHGLVDICRRLRMRAPQKVRDYFDSLLVSYP